MAPQSNSHRLGIRDLIERKVQLKQILPKSVAGRIRFTDHVLDRGLDLFAELEAEQLEGGNRQRRIFQERLKITSIRYRKRVSNEVQPNKESETQMERSNISEVGKRFSSEHQPENRGRKKDRSTQGLDAASFLALLLVCSLPVAANVPAFAVWMCSSR